MSSLRLCMRSVRQMPYLEAVVLEALRLYSPAYMVGRCARAETSLGPYVLPAGTTVLVSPYVMHRDPTVWEEPEAFRPERWQELQARCGGGRSCACQACLLER